MKIPKLKFDFVVDVIGEGILLLIGVEAVELLLLMMMKMVKV